MTGIGDVWRSAKDGPGGRGGYLLALLAVVAAAAWWLGC
jgi:hypothetical protein